MMSLLEEIFFNTSVQELILRMVFLLFFRRNFLAFCDVEKGCVSDDVDDL